MSLVYVGTAALGRPPRTARLAVDFDLSLQGRPLLPRFRCRNPSRIYRNRPLNLHLNRGSHIEPDIVATLQQSPSDPRRSARAGANRCAIQTARKPSCQRAAGASVHTALGCVLNFLASIFILLN